MNLSQEGKVSLISQFQLNATCWTNKMKNEVHTDILIEKEKAIDKTQHF